MATRILVYEYFTVLGRGDEPDSPEAAIYHEGRAMRDALVRDLQAVPGVEPVVLPDGLSLQTERDVFDRVAAGCQLACLIAPETADLLAARAEWLVAAGVESLGSPPAVIRTAGDKLAMAQVWRRCGVPTPDTSAWADTPVRFPAVVKPRDGAGSRATYRVTDPVELELARDGFLAAGFSPEQMIWQEYVTGQAASVAFLCGPRDVIPLLPGFQLLSEDGQFRYQGGEIPLPQELVRRAVTLGRNAVRALPGLRGYVGVDLVLGPASDGSRDTVIELNPRLTTAYLGLRQLARFNLAEAWLRVVRGQSVSLSWKTGSVRFRPDGGSFSRNFG